MSWRAFTTRAKAGLGLRWMLGTVVRLLVFASIAAGGHTWAAWDAARVNPDDGANIEVGLVISALPAMLAFVWGGIDGWRRLPPGALLIRWAAVGFASGVVTSAVNSLDANLPERSLLLASIADLGLLASVLVAGAAVAGAELGKTARRDDRSIMLSPNRARRGRRDGQ